MARAVKPGGVSRTGADRPGIFGSKLVLLIGFAFSVMGDPVSSVAYAIEAGLRALHGDLALLIPTMVVVMGVIALVDINYHQLIGRFPRGGGSAAAAAAAFGESWAFLPLGALIVDYALTIAISVAAGSSAIIAYAPGLAADRIPMALTLTLVVAALTWFGHGGRTIFALMTLLFVGIAAVVIFHGFTGPVATSTASLGSHGSLGFAGLSVLFAFPVGMALATGTEAPSSAIAQLGQVSVRERPMFGRVTIWLTLGIVTFLTLGLTILAVRLRTGIPPANTTLIAMTAADSVGKGGLFAAFQLSSALLLLSAANSSFNAGPGVLKALASRQTAQATVGILPRWLARTNRYHTPYWGVVLFLLAAALLVIAARGDDQVLVLFYAVAVFVSFLFGLLAMASFSLRERRPSLVVANVAGAVLVVIVLAVDMARVYPLVSLAAAGAIGAGLYLGWVRAGRPKGVSEAEDGADRGR